MSNPATQTEYRIVYKKAGAQTRLVGFVHSCEGVDGAKKIFKNEIEHTKGLVFDSNFTIQSIEEVK
jgi:hypothetical protein